MRTLHFYFFITYYLYQQIHIVQINNKQKMRSMHIKIIGAQQAKIYIYKNLQLKLLKTNAAIWFNKIAEPNN